MIVLGIESSCDETAAALVNEKREILAETVLSQEEHKIYGGRKLPPVRISTISTT